MILTNLLLIALFNTSNASATDEWLCTQESSQRRSNAILSCGIGIAKDEAGARAVAFRKATEEFHRVCDISEDCKDHLFQVVPQRTTCELIGSNQKCYRLVTFYIGTNFTPKKRAQILVAEIAEKVKNEAKKIKLRIGMKKAKVLEVFGTPISVSILDSSSMSLHYDNRFCLTSYGCFIMIERGKITDFQDVDPAFLDL